MNICHFVITVSGDLFISDKASPRSQRPPNAPEPFSKIHQSHAIYTTRNEFKLSAMKCGFGSRILYPTASR